MPAPSYLQARCGVLCRPRHAWHGTHLLHACNKRGPGSCLYEHPVRYLPIQHSPHLRAHRRPMAAGAPPDPGLSGKRFAVLYSGKGVLEYGNVQVSREGRGEVGARPTRCRRR